MHNGDVMSEQVLSSKLLSSFQLNVDIAAV